MEKPQRAAVVVLGDFGRSPRMQYHSLSLARQANMEVDVIAYAGAHPHCAVLENKRIHLHLVNPPNIQRLPGLLRFPLKALILFFYMSWIILFKIPAPDFFLVQNPPSIPAFAVVKFACWFRKSTFIIDWHNFGYTLLALSLSPRNPLVRLYFLYEKLFGKMADAHLCVSKAMQYELAQNWGIRATVMYDKPPDFFQPTPLEKRHELFSRLGEALINPLSLSDCCSRDQIGEISQDDDSVWKYQRTLFTCCRIKLEDLNSASEIQESSEYFYLKERPALIVSSTSWTADEDFSVLLEAALLYDRRVSAILDKQDADSVASDDNLYPRLLFIITGKGPMREKYEKDISKMRLRRVAFRTMWLSAADYPTLLGSADLGVSLHTSSSGMDLPMKIVDMFGCGLPVAAASYACISELVKDGENGLLFQTSSQLAQQLMKVFKGFPEKCDELNCLRSGVLAASRGDFSWNSEWEKHVFPLFHTSNTFCC